MPKAATTIPTAAKTDAAKGSNTAKVRTAGGVLASHPQAGDELAETCGMPHETENMRHAS